MNFSFITAPDRKSRIAREVLEDLPEWFGIEESREEYIRESANMPFVAGFSGGDPVGFMALKETSPYTAEIYVCGVKKRFHRQQAGSVMFSMLRDEAKKRGYEFLQVKTVAAGCCREYDATRTFYERMGFRALEVFPTLWDESNPCLVMVMAL